MTRRRRLEMPQILEVAGSAVTLANALHVLAPEVPEFFVARKMLQDGLQILADQQQRDAQGGPR
jgi:hypothetical protein